MNTSRHQRKVFNIMCRWKSSSSIQSQSASGPDHAFIEEIHVPLPNNNYLSGKLWTGTEANSKNAAFISKKELPPIICTHGWLDNASSFDPLLEQILKPGMTAFAFDLPGHGFSSHTSNSYYDILMDGFMALGRIRRHFNWDKVVLLGHSAGAVISFIYSSVFPESVHSYIGLDNLCPLPTLDPVEQLRRISDANFKVDQKLQQQLPALAYTYEDILQKLFLGRDNILTKESCEVLLRRGAKQRPDGKYYFTHDLRATIVTWQGRFHQDASRQMCTTLDSPMCIIKGEPGIDYVSREVFLSNVENIRKSNKHPVEFHLVPGTHHFHLNTPELVAPIINNFVWK